MELVTVFEHFELEIELLEEESNGPTHCMEVCWRCVACASLNSKHS